MLRVDRFMNPISCAGVFFLPGASGTWLPAYPGRPSTRKGSVSSPRQTAHMGSAVARDHPRRFPPLRWRRRYGSVTGQRLIGQSAPDNGTEHGDEAPGVGQLPRVEPKRLFIKIAEQVEGFDAGIGAFDAALEQRPEVFEPVSVDLSAHVGLGVVNDLVGVVAVQVVVGRQRIGVDLRARLDMLPHFRGKGPAAGIGHHLDADGAMPVGSMALQEPHGGGLAYWTSALDLGFSAVLVHEAGLPADKGLVHFDFPAHLSQAPALHGEPDAVEHKPRGFLRDPECPGDFGGADPVLVVHEQPDGGQPPIESEGRILEDGPRLYGKLPERMVGAALPAAIGREEGDLPATTPGASHTIRPPQPDHEGQAGVSIGEVADRFEQGLGSGVVLFHAPIIAHRAGLVVYYCPDEPVTSSFAPASTRSANPTTTISVSR